MQFIFDHGDEILQNDGTFVKTTRLRALSGSLPIGMMAQYMVRYDPVKRTEETDIMLQARDQHGRRYTSDRTEMEAQRHILRWAARVLREIRRSHQRIEVTPLRGS